MNHKHRAAFAALSLLWGTTWIPSQTLAQQLPPLLTEAIRFLLAALILLPFLRSKPRPGPRPFRYLLLLSATMIVLPYVLLLWARQNIPSATVAVLFSTMPLLVVLLTPLFEDQPIPNAVMPTSIAAIGAIAVAVGASFSANQAIGAAILFLAVAASAISALIAQRELRPIHPGVTTAILSASASLLFFFASLVFERGESVQWTRDLIAPLLLLGTVGGALAYVLYFWLLQQLTAYQAATVQWTAPLVALLEAALILRMRLSFNMIAGSLVTLVCVTMVLRARAKDDDTVSLVGN